MSKRLGPVGIAKVVAQLGPRGVLNLASHIMSRSADEIRARSARLNPDRTEQLNPEQLNPDKDSMDEVSAELVRRFGARSSSGSSGSNGSNLKEGGKGAAVRPATGPLVALLQLVLAAIAGEQRGHVRGGCELGCGEVWNSLQGRLVCTAESGEIARPATGPLVALAA